MQGKQCLQRQKDHKSGVNWLLQRCINALRKDNEKLRAANRQLVAKCERQSLYGTSWNILISFSGKTDQQSSRQKTKGSKSLGSGISRQSKQAVKWKSILWRESSAIQKHEWETPGWTLLMFTKLPLLDPLGLQGWPIFPWWGLALLKCQNVYRNLFTMAQQTSCQEMPLFSLPAHVLSHSGVSDSATPWTVALKAPLFMEFSR